MAEHPTLTLLKKLQAIDLDIDHLETKKEEAESALASSLEGLAQAQAGLTQKKKDAETALKARAAMELESRTKLASISKHKEEIYQVKSNEAYAALQTEIARLATDNASIEEQILVKMEEEESLRKAIVQAQARVKEAEKLVQDEQAQYQRQAAEIDAQVQVKTVEQEQIAGQIDRAVLDRYRKIRDNRGGTAIAEVRDGICGGCRMTVRPHLIIEVQRSPDLVHCESCSRILYME